MPVNKNALLRYRVIDSCLTNPMKRYPSMEMIVEKIQDQLGVSISNSLFSKDIQRMKEIYSAPIKFDRVHNGYCYTENDFSIKEFPLTVDEIEALDYSTALLHQLKGTKMFQQFENAINKVIEGYRVSKILGKSEKQILQVEEPIKSEGSQWLEKILKAIVEKSVLQIVYQGFGKEEKTHNFSPYLLKEYRNRWYAVGFSTINEKVIVLALDRIKKISRSKENFITDESFSPAKFFKYSFGITQLHDANPERVRLSFLPEQMPYITTQPLHQSQKIIDETTGHVIVEMEVYITTELKMAILSFGKNVEVLQPLSLRKEISDLIKEMSETYKN